VGVLQALVLTVRHRSAESSRVSAHAATL
jgi:hypothetical protein